MRKEKLENFLRKYEVTTCDNEAFFEELLGLFRHSGFISKSCKDEKCSVCSRDATNKLAEVVFDDDPIRNRHELTAYVCRKHFKMIVGDCG